MGDMWHLGYGSTSLGMMLVSHVNPHHIVWMYPCGYIDPWPLFLCGSKLQSSPNPLNENPLKSPVSRLSDLAPRILFLPTTEIYFDVRDFGGFILHRLLVRFLQSMKSLDYGIAFYVSTHPTVLAQWTTLDRE
jgi:hypothetical protein